MSTLVPASVGSAQHTALVLRRPAEEGRPTEERHWSRGDGGTSRSIFVVDGPPAGPRAATPVVVLAVNVVPRRAEPLEPPGAEPPTFRAFGRGTVGEPYAPASPHERGTLVDAYV